MIDSRVKTIRVKTTTTTTTSSVLHLMRVGRILIWDRITNKDSLLLLLQCCCRQGWHRARLSSVRDLNGSVLRVLRVERMPLDFHE